MQNQKTIVISYLTLQLKTFKDSKQFAESKFSIINSTNCEDQIKRCNYHIGKLTECITWLNQVEITEPSESN